MQQKQKLVQLESRQQEQGYLNNWVIKAKNIYKIEVGNTLFAYVCYVGIQTVYTFRLFTGLQKKKPIT